jgi:hypothetical protein
MFGLSLPPQVQEQLTSQLAALQLTTLHLRSIKEIAPLWLPAMATLLVVRHLVRRSLQFLATQATSFIFASVDTPKLVRLATSAQARSLSFSQHQVLAALELPALAMSFTQLLVATTQFAAQTFATSTHSAVKLDGIKVVSI